MAAVELAPELADDFERILEHLVANAAQHSASSISDIISKWNREDSDSRGP
jgi:hypothetical protein